MKKREPRHYVRADMLPDYMDEHDGEVPSSYDNREPKALNYGCADIDDIDGIIAKMYHDV